MDSKQLPSKKIDLTHQRIHIPHSKNQNPAYALHILHPNFWNGMIKLHIYVLTTHIITASIHGHGYNLWYIHTRNFSHSAHIWLSSDLILFITQACYVVLAPGEERTKIFYGWSLSDGPGLFSQPPNFCLGMLWWLFTSGSFPVSKLCFPAFPVSFLDCSTAPPVLMLPSIISILLFLPQAWFAIRSSRNNEMIPSLGFFMPMELGGSTATSACGMDYFVHLFIGRTAIYNGRTRAKKKQTLIAREVGGKLRKISLCDIHRSRQDSMVGYVSAVSNASSIFSA